MMSHLPQREVLTLNPLVVAPLDTGIDTYLQVTEQVLCFITNSTRMQRAALSLAPPFLKKRKRKAAP